MQAKLKPLKPARIHPSRIELRWYQREIADQTYGHMMDSASIASVKSLGPKKIPLIGSPTGAGKSYGIVALCERILDTATDHGDRGAVLIILGFQSLVWQFEASFRAYGFDRGDVSIGWGSRTSKDTAIANSRVLICMAQTLEKRPDLLDKFKPTAVIFDEAHITAYRPAAVLVRSLPTAYASASFVRPDGGINWDHHPMVDPIGMKELVAQNSLVPMKILSFDGVLKLPKVSSRRDAETGELYPEDQELLIAALQKNFILDQWRLHGGHHPTFAFCYSQSQAEEFCDYFNAQGIGSELVIDSTSPKRRLEIFKLLKEGKISIVLSVNAISTGTDVPCVANVMLLTRIGSLSKGAQACGRATRPYPGKTHGVIFDFCGTYDQSINENALTPPAEMNWRSVQYPSLDCDRCGTANPRSRKICRNCDAVLSYPDKEEDKAPEIVFGELEESPDELEMDGDSMIPVYGDELGDLELFQPAIALPEIPRLSPALRQKRQQKFRGALKKAYASRVSPESAIVAYRKEFDEEPDLDNIEGAIFGNLRREVTVGDFVAYLEFLMNGANFKGTEAKVWLTREFGDRTKEFGQEFQRSRR